MSSKPALLLTGASGFVGRHVIAQGRNRFAIVATGRGPRPAWLPADVSWSMVDLLDRNSVANLPADLPFVLHLASETVPSKFSSYEPLLDSVEMTLNVCRHARAGRLLFASSCLVYAASGQSLAEDAPLDPRGRYGLTKQLCEEIMWRTQGIEAVIARPFNHLGVGMRPDLVVPSIVRRVRDAPDGATIEMAGLDSVRDFLDVKDIVAAYISLLELPTLPARVFNVASGNATSISEIVHTVAHILGKPIGGVIFSDQCNSSDDTSTIVGDARRLQEVTAWQPTIGLEESLSNLIMFDRSTDILE